MTGRTVGRADRSRRLFAYRSPATGSLLLVTLEHALWGNLLFTTGLGWYFSSGSIQ